MVADRSGGRAAGRLRSQLSRMLIGSWRAEERGEIHLDIEVEPYIGGIKAT